MRQAGWEVHVVTPRAHDFRKPKGTRYPFPETGSHGEFVRSYPSIAKPRSIPGKIIKNVLDGALMLPRALLQARPNVVIATVPAIPTMFVGFIVARIFQRPFVLEMRDAWPDLISDSRILKWDWLINLAHRAVRYIQRQATLVVTVTTGFADVLEKDGIRSVQTVHNGISTRNFVPLQVQEEPSDAKLHVLYLGNVGESQGLESIILASTLATEDVLVRIVGDGTAMERLRRYASSVGAAVDFQEPARDDMLRAHYLWADTCVVSLRDDWASFDHTVPSKAYELLSLGRHVTGIVKGEVAKIIEDAAAGDVVDHDPSNIAALWKQLAADRKRLNVGPSGQQWVFEKASLEKLGEKYMKLIIAINEQGSNCEKN
ncbi:glycosyltransferase family 4 protein [Paeniglutamicibacter sp. NPDC012692]|uniref:glycosyltransferase family 4 protein n=1 Tax=Paeniglutamicibacter sp. NPDC012692 TaxID=3364388 RepID=UPI0036B6C744